MNRFLSSHYYDYDAARRRTAATRFGSAYGPLEGVTDVYGYNARSEVVQARRMVGNEVIRGFNFDYAYDPIGNRVTSTYYDEQGDARTSAYSANELNQYTQRTVPGNVQVRGEADADATVTVNGNPAWRYPDFGGLAASYVTISFLGYANHTVVLCRSYDTKGKEVETIMFDYWANRPAGEDPATWFYSRYDIENPPNKDKCKDNHIYPNFQPIWERCQQ